MTARTLHFGIHVRDMDQSIAFYTAIGYEVVGRVASTPLGDLAMLKLPTDQFVTIELACDTSQPQPAAASNPSHFVIEVPSMADFIAALHERGIVAAPPTSPDDSDDFLTSWLVDPDGTRIELVQWSSGHGVGMSSADFETADPGATPTTSADDATTERLQHLIETLENGQLGFAEASQRLEARGHVEIASAFAGLSEQRAEFARQLRELRPSSDTPAAAPSGSAPGAMHRGWIAIQDRFTGDDAHRILRAVEDGETHTMTEFDAALDSGLPTAIRAVVDVQRVSLKEAHNLVTALLLQSSSKP